MPALKTISTNVPVATSKPEIRWPEPNIITPRDNLFAAFRWPVCRSHGIEATPEKPSWLSTSHVNPFAAFRRKRSVNHVGARLQYADLQLLKPRHPPGER